MAHYVTLLLTARLRLLWNGFRRGTLDARIGWMAAGIALLGGAAFAVLSVGLFALSLLLAERLHYSGWANLHAEPAGRRRRAKREERPAVELALLPRPVQGFLLKDLRLFLRDPQGWSEMLMPVAVYALFIVQGLRQRDDLGTYAEIILPAVALSLPLHIGTERLGKLEV